MAGDETRKALESFRKKVEEDQAFRDRFTRDPLGVIREHGLDERAVGSILSEVPDVRTVDDCSATCIVTQAGVRRRLPIVGPGSEDG